MAMDPESKPLDEEALSQSRAIKLALAGIALFFSGPLVMSFSSSLNLGDFMLVMMLAPFLMVGGIGMTIYWSIAAWRRRSPRRQTAPREFVGLLAADAAPDDYASDGQSEPEVEKKGAFSFLFVVVITLCATHMACIGAIHTARPTSGDYLGFGILITVVAASALAALIVGLAGSLLRSFGQAKKVRKAAAALVVCSIGVQAWHILSVKAARAERRAQVRLSRGLDDPMPPGSDFSLRIDHHNRNDIAPPVPEIDILGRDWSLRYLHRRSTWQEECVGKLRPSQAVDLQVQLEAARRRLDAGSPLCAGLPGGEPMFTVTYVGAGGDWSWVANTTCLLRPDIGDREANRLSKLIDGLTPVWEDEERVICEFIEQSP